MRKIFGFSAQKILCCPTKKAKHHPMLAASGHHRFKAYSHCLQIHLQCKKKFVRNTECLLFKSRRKKRQKKRLIVNCFLLSITKCHFFVYLTKNKQLHYRIFSLIWIWRFFINIIENSVLLLAKRMSLSININDR
jgi:hypothetical protein